MKTISLILIFLAFIIVVHATVDTTSLPMDNSQIAPDFSLRDIYGSEISLSDNKGKVIFLNFWATWCPPCRYEIPDFVETYEKYKDKGMEIIGVSLDKKSPEELIKFAKKYKITYPIVFGNQQILNDYRPGRLIPTTFIIDPKGKIRHKNVGPMDKKSLEHYFLELKKE